VGERVRWNEECEMFGLRWWGIRGGPGEDNGGGGVVLMCYDGVSVIKACVM